MSNLDFSLSLELSSKLSHFWQGLRENLCRHCIVFIPYLSEYTIFVETASEMKLAKCFRDPKVRQSLLNWRVKNLRRAKFEIVPLCQQIIGFDSIFWLVHHKLLVSSCKDFAIDLQHFFLREVI